MKTFLIFYSFLFSSVGLGADAVKNICTHENPPHVYIYPADADGNTKLVFKTPDFTMGQPEHVHSVKVQDKDGSLSLLLSCYVLQDKTIKLETLKPTLMQLLQKRLTYWQAELAKTTDSDRKVLIQETIDMMNFEIKKGSTSPLDATDCQKIVTDVLGPMTDYDKVTTYNYSEFKNGEFTTQPAKKLSDILPAEFYQTISSTSTGGVYDLKNAGNVNCIPMPVLSSATMGPDASTKAAASGGQ